MEDYFSLQHVPNGWIGAGSTNNLSSRLHADDTWCVLLYPDELGPASFLEGRTELQVMGGSETTLKVRRPVWR